MSRKISVLLIGLAGLSAPLAMTAPASAANIPVLYCQVFSYHRPISGGQTPVSCGTFRPDSMYVADFVMPYTTGPYYWTLPGTGRPLSHEAPIAAGRIRKAARIRASTPVRACQSPASPPWRGARPNHGGLAVPVRAGGR
jgi:hypothetical protein